VSYAIRGLPQRIKNILVAILNRYDRYGKLIRYPGEWGERAFRFWLIVELLMNVLGWPPQSIVLGERYDVLLLDNEIRPVIYIETKRPNISISEEHVEEAKERAKDYFSIQYVVVTNGKTWILYDAIKNEYVKIVDLIKAEEREVAEFFSKLSAENFLVESAEGSL